MGTTELSRSGCSSCRAAGGGAIPGLLLLVLIQMAFFVFPSASAPAGLVTACLWGSVLVGFAVEKACHFFEKSHASSCLLRNLLIVSHIRTINQVYGQIYGNHFFFLLKWCIASFGRVE